MNLDFISASTLAWIIGFFLVLDFLLTALSEGLSLKRLPTQDTTDSTRTSTAYQRETTVFSLVHQGVYLLFFIAFWTLGGFAQVDQGATALSQHSIGKGLAFAALLGLIKMIFDLPFSIYSTFHIEQRYGFNKTTKEVFIADRLKGLILGGLLGGLAFGLVILFFEKSHWAWAWLAITLFQVTLFFLAPALIMPLFNRFTPLADPALSEVIHEYFKKINFPLQTIYQMDGSRRSTKANAFFTGFGKFRKLVLFDTLIQKHPKPELLAILAHEVGHYRLGHIPRMLIISIITTGLLFFAASPFIGSPLLCQAFGLQPQATHLIGPSLIFIGFLYIPATRFLSILTHALYRRHEFEADRFSLQTYPVAGALETALVRLHQDHYSHPNPHPLTVILEYTHPPLQQRLDRLKAHP